MTGKLSVLLDARSIEILYGFARQNPMLLDIEIAICTQHPGLTSCPAREEPLTDLYAQGFSAGYQMALSGARFPRLELHGNHPRGS